MARRSGYMGGEEENAMSFWIVSLTIAALVAASLALACCAGVAAARPGRRRMCRSTRTSWPRSSAIWRAASISADEAERSRVEVSRRLLEADRAAQAAGRPMRRTGQSVRRLGAGDRSPLQGVRGFTAQLGAPLYRDLPLQAPDRRRRGASRRAGSGKRPPKRRIGAVQIDPNADPEHLELMAKLREALKDRPDDLAGL